MLSQAIRRLFWIFPTIIGVSIITFLFLSYVPDPTDDPEVARVLAAEELTRLRRERFLDLPRFINPDPRDVRARVEDALAALAAGGPESERARHEIARLGGAALPYILPALDALAPEPRKQIALALAPIARRMGIASGDEVDDPARAVAFWTRFWDDRGVEFRHVAVRSAVRRLLRYESSSHAIDLIELDTFALDDIIFALRPPQGEVSLRRARALIDVAAHITGRDDRIALNADIHEARACVDRWRAYWAVYRSDYVAFTGSARITAMALETRYGKWALDAISYRFGRRPGGGSVLGELTSRAPVTLTILLGAILLAYAAAIPIGALTAAYRGHRLDLVTACVVLGLYSVPTAVIATTAAHVFGQGTLRLGAAIVILALGLIAAPARQERSALAAALSQDYVLAARARGASPGRALVVHALRNALLPIVTLAALEAPMALSGAFVVERVFGLRGIGEATIHAVIARDIAWLMAISMFAAFGAAILVIVTDAVYTLIDPRLRDGVFAQKGRSR